MFKKLVAFYKEGEAAEEESESGADLPPREMGEIEAGLDEEQTQDQDESQYKRRKYVFWGTQRTIGL